jgi:antitoxin (DNA-binding transcriptional repressor) of toxin-antitoxin stability system
MYVLSEVRVKTVSPTELRSNIYKLLDEVLSSGVPLEINKGGEILRIVPVATTNKLSNLVSRPHVIAGNPDDLVDICWDGEMNLDLY